MNKVLIYIDSINRKVYAPVGSNLLEVLREEGIILPSSCGGKGICGKCLVGVEKFNDIHSLQKTEQSEADKNIQYACQVSLNESIKVTLLSQIIDSNLINFRKVYSLNVRVNVKPCVSAKRLRIKQKYDKSSSALYDFNRKIEGKACSEIFIKKILNCYVQNEFNGYFITRSNEIIDWIPEKEFKGTYGLTVDLGTTTIGVELVDLKIGETVAFATELNPQVKYGDDVISRISFASVSRDNLHLLHLELVKVLNKMIKQIESTLGVNKQNIYDLVVAGNTPMIHFFLNIDPSSLGQYPFVPIIRNHVVVDAGDIGINVFPKANCFIFPSIGGFVGGDIVAGILATDLHKRPEPVLFIDLGTNGEIVVWNGSQLWACSTAMGPAFEGGRIQCGMRAMRGAIEHVLLSSQGELKMEVVGDVEPEGICGSGLIDLIAILLNNDVVDYTGRLRFPSEKVPEWASKRLLSENTNVRFCLWKGDTREIFIDAKDVRQFQLACSAIRCGVKLMLRCAGLDPRDIKKVYIAGTFGYHLNKENFLSLGILPEEIDKDKIEFVGNSSLAGAKMALINKTKREESITISRKVKHIDLSTLPGFEEEFAMSMFFPERG